MGFWTSMTKSLQVALSIIPHLIEILGVIVKKSNGPTTSTDQLSILKPDLIAFDSKLQFLEIIDHSMIPAEGVSFDLHSLSSAYILKINLLSSKIKHELFDLIVSSHILRVENFEIPRYFKFLISEFDRHLNIVSMFPITDHLIKNDLTDRFDSGLSAFKTMNPVCKIAPSGYLPIANSHPYVRIVANEQEALTSYSWIKKAFSCTVSNEHFGYKTTEFMPSSSFYPNDASLFYFSKDLCEVTLGDIAVNPITSKFDHYYSPPAIWNTLNPSLANIAFAFSIMIKIGSKYCVSRGVSLSYEYRFSEYGLLSIYDLLNFHKLVLMKEQGFSVGMWNAVFEKLVAEMELISIGMKHFQSFNDELSSLMNQDQNLVYRL